MLIFIHGFNSSGKGEKAMQLQAALPDIELVAPTLSYVPEKAMKELQKLINKGMKRKKPVALIGSSLGGFYAAWLAAQHELPSIMINPLIDPALLSEYIGPQENFSTGKSYTWKTEHCEQLNQYVTQASELSVTPLVLVDQGDEVLGHWQAMQHYEGYGDIRLYPGGSHRFEHLGEAMPVIRKYLEGRC